MNKCMNELIRDVWLSAETPGRGFENYCPMVESESCRRGVQFHLETVDRIQLNTWKPFCDLKKWKEPPLWYFFLQSYFNRG